MSILLAAVAQNTVQLSYGRVEDFVFTAPSNAIISFNSDGTISGLDEGSPKWFNIAPQTGVGANYEIFVSRIAGSLPTGTMDTWLSLSAGQAWTLTQSAAGERLSTIRVQIRPNSGSTMAQADYDMSAEVYSGS